MGGGARHRGIHEGRMHRTGKDSTRDPRPAGGSLGQKLASQEGALPSTIPRTGVLDKNPLFKERHLLVFGIPEPVIKINTVSSCHLVSGFVSPDSLAQVPRVLGPDPRHWPRKARSASQCSPWAARGSPGENTATPTETQRHFAIWLLKGRNKSWNEA